MVRSIYDVSRHELGWQVKKRGNVQATSVNKVKDEAVQRARALALANQPSQVVVSRLNGTIEFEWTYGNDPYPPQG